MFSQHEGTRAQQMRPYAVQRCYSQTAPLEGWIAAIHRNIEFTTQTKEQMLYPTLDPTKC